LGFSQESGAVAGGGALLLSFLPCTFTRVARVIQRHQHAVVDVE
jgi:hypothetical protein